MVATPAVAYCRTSSMTNVGEDKDSKARQLLSITTYATTAGYDIQDSGIFYDEGMSGTQALMFRPAWRNLLQHCEESNIKTIIFEDSSRFARELVIQEQGYQEMIAQGYTLISASNPGAFLEDSAEATLIRQILGSIHQFQRDSSNQRLKGARERSAAAKGKKSILTGKTKATGRQSRLESADGPKIVEILNPFVLKAKCTNIDIKDAAAHLAAQGITSKAGTPFSKSVIQQWIVSLKGKNKEKRTRLIGKRTAH